MKKKVLIAGGRSKAKSLAVSLKERGYSPVILNRDFRECERLAETAGLKVICGDATRPQTLQDLSAYEFSQIIALCPRDEDNLMICRLASALFPSAMTISLVSDLNKKQFFEQMGADKVICAASAVSALIENEAFLESVSSAAEEEKNRIRIVEADVLSGDACVHKRLWEMGLPEGVIVGCILRHDWMVVPHGETRLLAGDHLILMMSSALQEQVVGILKGGPSHAFPEIRAGLH